MQNNFKKISFILPIMFFTLFLFVFLFLYKEINSNDQKAEQSVVELKNEVSQRDEIKSLNLLIETIKKDRTLLETHFAKSSDIVPFLDTIEALALKVGVKAEVNSVDVLKDSGVLTVQVSASGNFEGLYKFLTLLENSPYELDFIGMDMKKEVQSDLNEKDVQKLKWRTVFRIRLLSFVQ